jgi:hypothetical protein
MTLDDVVETAWAQVEPLFDKALRAGLAKYGFVAQSCIDLRWSLQQAGVAHYRWYMEGSNGLC